MASIASPLAEQQLIEQLHATIQSLEEALERGEQEKNALVRTIATLNTSSMMAVLKDSGMTQSRSASIVSTSHVDPSSTAGSFHPPSSHAAEVHGFLRSHSSSWKLAYRVDDDVENVTLAAFKQLMNENRGYKIEIEQLQRTAKRWHSEAEQKERLWQKRLTEANEVAQASQQKCRSLEIELRALQVQHTKTKGLLR